MTSREAAALWRGALRESVWGQRGVAKAGALWLPLAVMGSLLPPEAWARAAGRCFLVLASVVCWAVASILGNDLADRCDDRAARKDRWVQRLPRRVGTVVVAALAGIGGLVLAASGGGGGVLAAYAGAVGLGLLYSVRPLRFKERGALGPLAYSVSGALAYLVLPWAWLSRDWRALAALGPAVVLDKWVNLHFHQAIDYDEDRARGSRTYAVGAGPTRARRTLQWAASLASAAMLAVLGFVAIAVHPTGPAVVAAIGVLALAAGVYARGAARRPAAASALIRELPWHYLGLTHAVFRMLPPVLFARLAVEEPRMWAPAAASGLWALAESWHAIRYHYE